MITRRCIGLRSRATAGGRGQRAADLFNRVSYAPQRVERPLLTPLQAEMGALPRGMHVAAGRSVYIGV